MQVIGYASSAPFRGTKRDSDERNMKLANERAANVWTELKKAGAEGKPTVWEDPDKMFSLRRYIDQSERGERLVSREPLDRRVDVAWCGP